MPELSFVFLVSICQTENASVQPEVLVMMLSWLLCWSLHYRLPRKNKLRISLLWNHPSGTHPFSLVPSNHKNLFSCMVTILSMLPYGTGIFAVIHLYILKNFLASVHSFFFLSFFLYFKKKNQVLINRQNGPQYQCVLTLCAF